MATAATIKKNIAKLEAALKSKATPKSLKSKLEAQLVKSKAELSGINKGSKPKTSTTKSTQTALQKLKEMVNKNKKLKTYKKSGVDLEKDADRPALPIGRRTAKQSGKTYYEYRANRIDVKQPPKRYPKLEKGGYFAKGGMVNLNQYYKTLGKKDDLVGLKVYDKKNEEFIFIKDVESGIFAGKNKNDEFGHIYSMSDLMIEKMADGGYMAKGGKTKMPEWAVTITSEDGDSYDWDGFAKSEDDALYKAEQEAGFDSVESSVIMITDENGEKIEYAKGGYMAKGGLTEHGLKVGDTIVGKGIYTIKVSNKETGFATVNLNTGEREEMKAMGGEMHRTQE